jgi:hypothetical protein
MQLYQWFVATPVDQRPSAERMETVRVAIARNRMIPKRYERAGCAFKVAGAREQIEIADGAQRGIAVQATDE